VGYIEAITGIGLIIGPLLGSTMYSLGGYDFTFYSFGGLFISVALFVGKIFPDAVDRMEQPRPDVQT